VSRVRRPGMIGDPSAPPRQRSVDPERGSPDGWNAMARRLAMRRVRLVVAVVLIGGSLCVLGWLAYHGRDTATAYVVGTLRDRLAGATVESSVPPETAAQWRRLVWPAMGALGGVAAGTVLLLWRRRVPADRGPAVRPPPHDPAPP
jgi:hypothetical protein